MCLAAALASLAFACTSHVPSLEPRPAEPGVNVLTPSSSARWTVARLEALSPVHVSWTHHEQTHDYFGVPLSAVLSNELALRATVDPSRGAWARAIVATAPDSYCAVLSAGELRENWGSTHAFLVWRQDGAELPTADGPFRLVVPSDSGGARCVRQVSEIRVVDLAVH